MAGSSSPQPAPMIPGSATRAGTETYAKTTGAGCGAGHYSDFLNQHLQLSSLGIGTFPGAAADDVDADYAAGIDPRLETGTEVSYTARA